MNNSPNSKYLKKINKGMYIHIPFCDDICSYCVFTKLMSSNIQKVNYVNALIKEIEMYKIKYSFQNVETIFIGGGTPTSLDIKELEKLLLYLNNSVYLSNIKEFSIESNPENLTLEKCLILHKYGVNRVSIGCQSFSNDELSYLNRHHNIIDIKNAVNNLKNVGITNVNLDFIYGLKNQTVASIKECIDTIFNIFANNEIKHLSFYMLEISNGCYLYNKKEDTLNDDESSDIYVFIQKYLEQKYNFIQYEVSNFSFNDNYKCLHNIKYWKSTNFFGFGVGSSKYLENIRSTNTKSINKYVDFFKEVDIDKLDNDDFNSLYLDFSNVIEKDKEVEDSKTQEFIYLMEVFRLNEGMSLDEYKKRFNSDFLIKYNTEINLLRDNFVITNNYIKIKPERLFVMNSILLDLLKF